MRARLLQFVTGTSKVPMGGFANLWVARPAAALRPPPLPARIEVGGWGGGTPPRGQK